MKRRPSYLRLLTEADYGPPPNPLHDVNAIYRALVSATGTMTPTPEWLIVKNLAEKIREATLHTPDKDSLTQFEPFLTIPVGYARKR